MGRLYALIAALAAVARLATCATDGGDGWFPSSHGKPQPQPQPQPPPVVSPRISSLSPTSILAGDPAFVLSVTGSGFAAESTVTVHGETRPTTFVSTTLLTAALPAADVASAGYLDVEVVTPGFIRSGMTLTVANPVPAISAVSPNPLTTGGGFVTLTVTGTGFMPESSVLWNGDRRPTSFIDRRELRAMLWDADLATSVAGAVTVVTAARPGGGTSAPVRVPVTRAAPTASAMSPTSVTPGAPGFALTIQGAQFNADTEVWWNGSPRPTTVLSPTLLQASIDPADVATAGAAAISVHTPAPGGGIASAGTFTIAAPRGDGPQAVAYQLDPAHSGHVEPGVPLSFPADPAWIVTLAEVASYPLVADGKVFILVRGADDAGGAGVRLVALELATGAPAWGPIALAGPSSWGTHAYEGGRLFVVTADGVLRSFDAASGAAGWSVALQLTVLSAPTASGGAVYLTGSSRVVAIAAESGAVRWWAWDPGIDVSSPAVGPDGVFVASRCQAYKLDLAAGRTIWRHDGACHDGRGRTAVYALHGLYVRADASGALRGTVLDPVSGASGASFGPAGGDPMPIPALGWSATYLVAGGALEARDLGGRLRWSFAAGGTLTSAPLVVGGAVIAGSSTGAVHALDAATGAPLWTGDAGAPIPAPDEQTFTQPLAGLAAGEGYLVVPAGRRVTAWRVVP